MHVSLAQLIKQNEIGFDDIFEAYAELCIQQVRDVTEDMILDEGTKELDLTIEGLTAHAVDWALVIVPERLGDVTDEVKKEDETWLEYIVRVAVEQRIAKTKALRMKLS